MNTTTKDMRAGTEENIVRLVTLWTNTFSDARPTKESTRFDTCSTCFRHVVAFHHVVVSWQQAPRNQITSTTTSIVTKHVPLTQIPQTHATRHATRISSSQLKHCCTHAVWCMICWAYKNVTPRFRSSKKQKAFNVTPHGQQLKTKTYDTSPLAHK